MNYLSMSIDELNNEKMMLEKEYLEYKSKNLKLDMSRGKPSSEQLDLSNKMLSCLCESDKINYEIDIRNYGFPNGLDEARLLMSNLMGCDKKNVIIGGNSSLSLMHDVISHFYINGFNGCEPWSKGKNKFLCPSPGYDRHFQMCEYFNIEMIPIKMTKVGPDIKKIESLVSTDESIKGIWCVPKYSNPEGITYSDETVSRLAKLRPLAKDFKILWDNAYSVHDFYEYKTLLNIFDECTNNGNQNFPIVFCSTAKITFPSGGISAIGCIDKNFEEMQNYYSRKTIGFDKINQLRHIKFLKNLDTIKAHMAKHAKILIPKFNLILDYFKKNFENNSIVKWTNPKGGYFISVETYGSAKRIETLCSNIGLTITSVGAAFPYNVDINDSNIRIAPSYPNIEELELAIKIFCNCVKISAIEKIIEQRRKTRYFI
ncbi:MAG: aminotransferase [Firmicutes bacterium]|nr:aminotransferase [Bacillota bacterium]